MLEAGLQSFLKTQRRPRRHQLIRFQFSISRYHKIIHYTTGYMLSARRAGLFNLLQKGLHRWIYMQLNIEIPAPWQQAGTRCFITELFAEQLYIPAIGRISKK